MPFRVYTTLKLLEQVFTIRYNATPSSQAVVGLGYAKHCRDAMHGWFFLPLFITTITSGVFGQIL